MGGDRRDPRAGVARTRQVLTTALGAGYARDVVGGTSAEAGTPVAVVIVRTTLPYSACWGRPARSRCPVMRR